MVTAIGAAGEEGFSVGFGHEEDGDVGEDGEED